MTTTWQDIKEHEDIAQYSKRLEREKRILINIIKDDYCETDNDFKFLEKRLKEFEIEDD